MNKTVFKATCTILSLSILGACSTGTDDEARSQASRAGRNAHPEPALVLIDQSGAAANRNQAPDRTPVEVLRNENDSSGEVEEIVVTAARISADTRALRQPAQGQAYGSPLVLAGTNESRERYASLEDNRVRQVLDVPVSTFSIDVDTASYSNIRRFLNNGQLPPADAVRTEELVNYFAYRYPRQSVNGQPFSVYTEISDSPWSKGRHLLHIGLQALDPDVVEDRAANLVFLVDVSGSMRSADKLDLLKTSLKLLARQLDAKDRVSLVVYAGASGVVLEPTPGDKAGRIIAALDRLQAGGSTNGAAGIELAYQLAREAYIDGGINRVILATDGDFNVGLSDIDALKDLIAEKRQSGISLTTLGFGTGNINDHLMEQLADNGNGNYAYIDTLNEARKVLVDEMSSTLQTVAKDVKIQIEFNPAVVTEYRLVGYENRILNREDFNNDKVDAGEIGAGHTVTALYEIALAGSGNASVDPLRYTGNQPTAEPAGADTGELAYLKLRYKAPEDERSTLLEYPLQVADIKAVDSTSIDFRFSAAVAGFAQLLRGNSFLGSFTYDDVIALAQPARGDDAFGYRAEFINLVRTAGALN